MYQAKPLFSQYTFKTGTEYQTCRRMELSEDT